MMENNVCIGQAVGEGAEKTFLEKQKQLENKLIFFMAEHEKNNARAFSWVDISYAMKIVFGVSISDDACRMRYMRIKSDSEIPIKN